MLTVKTKYTSKRRLKKFINSLELTNEVIRYSNPYYLFASSQSINSIRETLTTTDTMNSKVGYYKDNDPKRKIWWKCSPLQDVKVQFLKEVHLIQNMSTEEILKMYEKLNIPFDMNQVEQFNAGRRLL